MSVVDYSKISPRPQGPKSLLLSKAKSGGRNQQGHISVRHIGGGAKKKLRVLDSRREKFDIPAKIESIEYDPNRSAQIALVQYPDGEKRYIIAPEGLKVGTVLNSGTGVAPDIGNALFLSDIPLGTIIHNIEMKPGAGALIARSAGAYAQLNYHFWPEFLDDTFLGRNFDNPTLTLVSRYGFAEIHDDSDAGSGNNKEKRTTLGLERGMQLLELEKHSPIIASQRLTLATVGELAAQDGWFMRVPYEKRAIDLGETGNIIVGMEIDRETAVAKQILVLDAKKTVLNEEPQLTVESIKTTTGRVEIEYTANEAFLQLSYSHSPFLEIKIDDEPVEFWKTSINTIAVKTEAGKHMITIEGKQSSLRKMLMIVSGLAVIAAVLLFRRKRD